MSADEPVPSGSGSPPELGAPESGEPELGEPESEPSEPEPGEPDSPREGPRGGPGGVPENGAPRPGLRGAPRTVKKVFDYTLGVDNPVHFATNVGGHLLALLQDRLAGRNFKGARIVRVLEVQWRSAIHISRTSGTGGGFVDVRVLAEVAVFAKWDILVGVRIFTNAPLVLGTLAPQEFHGPEFRAAGGDPSAALAVIALVPGDVTRTLAPGHLVAVRVLQAQHPPMKQQAAVRGVPLSCDRAAPVYRLRGVLDRAAQAALGPLLAAAIAELEDRRALVETQRDDVWFFESLLHPYATPLRAAAANSAAEPGEPGDLEIPAWPGGPVWSGPRAPVAPGPAPLRSVIEIVRRAVILGESVPVAGVWSRPLTIARSSPLVAHVADGAPPAEWGAAVDGRPQAVFAEFLKNILDFLGATRELPQCYSTPELVKAHTGLWAAMRRQQRTG